jgi:toxin ParE1/3/4
VTVGAVLTRQARRELVRALQWIAKDNTDAAARFNDAVFDAAQRLSARPLLGRAAPAPFLPSYRFWSLPEFSYLLVYDPATDPVEILRCVHTSRDLPRALAELRRPPAP